MKKVLFASTALVAFGLAGAAQAADPISLKLGGYSAWVFGYADQEEIAPGVDFQDFDVKGTNEIFFVGSTTLDNGLKVGVTVELEAGGQPETTAAGTDVIDEAYVSVEGGFGRIVLGSEDPASYLLHVAAPVAVGSFYGEGEIGDRRWIIGAGNYMTTALGDIGGGGTDDNEKIIYFTPNFSGFTAGVSYTPSTDARSGDQPNQAPENFIDDVLHIGAAYNNSFSGVGVKLSAGYATALDEQDSGIPGVADEFSGWSLGAQFGYAGFTVGGSFKNIDLEAGGVEVGLDGQVWDAGISYATGPATVSFTYQSSETDSAAELAKDTILLSGKYNMGPGVDLIAGIGHVDYEAAGADVNDGWWAATGIALAF